jgi:hypothetical protein
METEVVVMRELEMTNRELTGIQLEYNSIMIPVYKKKFSDKKTRTTAINY